MTDVFKGATDQSFKFELVDETTGLPATSIVYTDITAAYVRTRSAKVDITPATLASASAAHSDGGFILVNDTTNPGVYRFDPPDAAFADGAREVVITIVATGCRPSSRQFDLVNLNDQVAYAPNAAHGAAGGMFTRGSGAGQINQSADGQIDVNFVRLLNDAQSATDAKDFFDSGYDPTTNRVAGIAELETAANDLALAVADIDSVVTNGTYGNAAIKALIDIVQTSITNLNNLSAKCNLFGPAVMEIPATDGTVFSFKMVVRDDEDKLVNLDGTPTLIATNAAGDNRASHLSAVTNPATGEYAFTYTVEAIDTPESLIIEASGTISGEARKAYYRGYVADYDQASLINTILTNVNSLVSSVGTVVNLGSGATLARNAVDIDANLSVVDGKVDTIQSQVNTIHGKLPSKSYLTGSDNSDGDVEMDEATGNYGGTVAGIAGTIQTLDQLDTAQDTQHATTRTQGGAGPWGGGGGGGGGDPIVVLVPGIAQVPERARGRLIELYVQEAITIAVPVLDANGDPMDLSAVDLWFGATDRRGTLQINTASSGSVTGTETGFSLTVPKQTSPADDWKWALRYDDADGVNIVDGPLTIKFSPSKP